MVFSLVLLWFSTEDLKIFFRNRRLWQWLVGQGPNKINPELKLSSDPLNSHKKSEVVTNSSPKKSKTVE
jgi:hypothetical protein